MYNLVSKFLFLPWVQGIGVYLAITSPKTKQKKKHCHQLGAWIDPKVPILLLPNRLTIRPVRKHDIFASTLLLAIGGENEEPELRRANFSEASRIFCVNILPFVTALSMVRPSSWPPLVDNVLIIKCAQWSVVTHLLVKRPVYLVITTLKNTYSRQSRARICVMLRCLFVWIRCTKSQRCQYQALRSPRLLHLLSQHCIQALRADCDSHLGVCHLGSCLGPIDVLLAKIAYQEFGFSSLSSSLQLVLKTTLPRSPWFPMKCWVPASCLRPIQLPVVPYDQRHGTRSFYLTAVQAGCNVAQLRTMTMQQNNSALKKIFHR